MRISDWSSDVCSSDLRDFHIGKFLAERQNDSRDQVENRGSEHANVDAADLALANRIGAVSGLIEDPNTPTSMRPIWPRSEEHTSELQSLMRISYAVFCLKKKKRQELIVWS